MTKLRIVSAITAAVAATAIVAGSSGASAQVVCYGTIFILLHPPTAYHGYSNQPANFGAPGTSIAGGSTTISELPTADCTGTIMTTTVTKTYLDGPGQSDYSKHNTATTTCQATGTAVCPPD